MDYEQVEARLRQLAGAALIASPHRTLWFGEETRHTCESSRELEALIRANAHLWFGLSLEHHLGLDWELGRVRHARLASAALLESLRGLFARAAMRSVGSFTVEGDGTHASLDGVWLAPQLARLDWVTGRAGALAPLRGQRLGLTSFSLRLGAVPSADDLVALAQLDAPRLTDFAFDARGNADEPMLLGIRAAPWFAGLRTARLTVSTPEGLAALLASTASLARLRDGLALVLAPHLLDSDRTCVREALPEAQLAPLSPLPDRDHTGPRPTVNAAPVKAPAHFRDLPPWGTKLGEGATGGSGIPFGDPAAPQFPSQRHCGRCGSAETRLIYASHVRSELNDYETQHFEGWEYECSACRHFTSCSSVWMV